jgi:hypothetical protein
MPALERARQRQIAYTLWTLDVGGHAVPVVKHEHILKHDIYTYACNRWPNAGVDELPAVELFERHTAAYLYALSKQQQFRIHLYI